MCCVLLLEAHSIFLLVISDMNRVWKPNPQAHWVANHLGCFPSPSVYTKDCKDPIHWIKNTKKHIFSELELVPEEYTYFHHVSSLSESCYSTEECLTGRVAASVPSLCVCTQLACRGPHCCTTVCVRVHAYTHFLICTLLFFD